MNTKVDRNTAAVKAERIVRYTKKLEHTLSNKRSKGGTIHVIYTTQRQNSENGKRYLRAIVNRNGIAVKYWYMTWEGRWNAAGDKQRPMEQIRESLYTPWDGSWTWDMDIETRIELPFLNLETE